MAAAMAEARHLDTLLDELLAWDSGDRDALRPSEPAQTMPVAVPTPPASRKRRRAGDADSKQWQEEALRLWESRTKTIAKKGEAPVPRLPSWQRRKLELKEAREEVERLEEKLRRLHGDTEMKTEDASVKQEASNKVDWKQVAELEKKKKEESEIENARLRGLIKKHHELADVLAPAISLAKTCQSVTVPRDSQDEALSGRTELFASMELRLNKKLAQVRGKIRRIRDNAADGQESCIVLDEASRPTVRVRRIKSMPFAVPVVMDIVRVYPHGGLLTGLALAIETQSISEDAVGLDFHMQVPPHAIGGSGFGVRTRGVMKRWSGEGREIFQFTAAREWMDAGSNVIAETSEYGWGYVREGVRRRQQGESTWMMVTSDSTLVSLHIDKVGMDSASFMNQVLLPACKYLDERLSQALENTLLDSLTTLK